MTVGIVMPTYNQAEWIDDALRSLRDQVYEDHELVVVDDGSTDGTTQMDVVDLRLPANRGTARAINAGVGLVLRRRPDARWLTWVSSDNEMRPAWLAALLAAADDDVGAVYGGFRFCQLPRGPNRYLFTPHDPDRLVGQLDCYYGPAFLIRREVWFAAGPHRGRICHDYDHWLRVEEACWSKGLRIVGVDQDLCMYRAHDARATIVRRKEYDAPRWQAEARERRARVTTGG